MLGSCAINYELPLILFTHTHTLNCLLVTGSKQNLFIDKRWHLNHTPPAAPLPPPSSFPWTPPNISLSHTHTYKSISFDISERRRKSIPNNFWSCGSVIKLYLQGNAKWFHEFVWFWFFFLTIDLIGTPQTFVPLNMGLKVFAVNLFSDHRAKAIFFGKQKL